MLETNNLKKQKVSFFVEHLSGATDCIIRDFRGNVSWLITCNTDKNSQALIKNFESVKQRMSKVMEKHKDKYMTFQEFGDKLREEMEIDSKEEIEAQRKRHEEELASYRPVWKQKYFWKWVLSVLSGDFHWNYPYRKNQTKQKTFQKRLFFHRC